MLRVDSISFNGSSVNKNDSSVVDNVVIATFNASYNNNSYDGNTSLYFSMSINNYDLYKENKTIVDADFEEFQNSVFTSIDDKQFI